MTINNDPRAALPNANVQAFYRVVRQGESTQTDDAYTLISGGAHFTDFSDHPYANQSAPPGKAAGAPQYIPHTWARMAKRYGLPDFSPPNQDIGFAGCLIEAGAMDDVIAGNLEVAIAKCHPVWTSLPGGSENNPKWNLEKAKLLYHQYGGTFAGIVDEQPAAPIEDQSTQSITPGVKPMGALAALQLFGPLLSGLIPQIKPLLTPSTASKTDQYVAIAQTIMSTILSTTGAPNLQGAVEAMTADKAIQMKVQQAVVSHPDVIQFMEVGGGFQAAREADKAIVLASAEPFWKTSAVFWISVILVPMVFWYVGSSIVGGIDIPAEWPWYAQLPLKLFGLVWDAGARVGLANLVVGLILGGICGVYYGISVTQNKQQQSQTNSATSG